MSQFDVAVLLLVLGAAVGWRFTVFGMLPVAFVVAVAVGLYSRANGGGGAGMALQIVEGLVMFEAAYLLGAMLAAGRRRLHHGAAGSVIAALKRREPEPK